MNHNNICIIVVPKGEEEGQGIENLFEKVVTENFPNLMREKVTHDQEAQGVSMNMSSRRPTPTHIIIKMPKVKDKERLLKAAKEKAELPTKDFP